MKAGNFDMFIQFNIVKHFFQRRKCFPCSQWLFDISICLFCLKRLYTVIRAFLLLFQIRFWTFIIEFIYKITMILNFHLNIRKLSLTFSLTKYLSKISRKFVPSIRYFTNFPSEISISLILELKFIIMISGESFGCEITL